LKIGPISLVRIFKAQKLTIGVDLGDRRSFYCLFDEAGKIILEQKVWTTPEAIKQTFGRYREANQLVEDEAQRHLNRRKTR